VFVRCRSHARRSNTMVSCETKTCLRLALQSQEKMPSRAFRNF
jgi:hypothetical protein